MPRAYKNKKEKGGREIKMICKKREKERDRQKEEEEEEVKKGFKTKELIISIQYKR